MMAIWVVNCIVCFTDNSSNQQFTT